MARCGSIWRRRCILHCVSSLSYCQKVHETFNSRCFLERHIIYIKFQSRIINIFLENFHFLTSKWLARNLLRGWTHSWRSIAESPQLHLNFMIHCGIEMCILLLFFLIFKIYYYYSRQLFRSAWVEFSTPSVCLFVRNITQKRMIPKCSNLV